MIAVVQRVTRASVTVASENYRAAIEHGLCVLLGVEKTDADHDADWIARKLANLRIFRDENHKMNRSVKDVGRSILLISQFTLAGDCTRGHRPSFDNAGPPELGQRLYERVATLLRDEHNLPVRTGIFAAMMQVELINDGPVTLIVRSPGSGQ